MELNDRQRRFAFAGVMVALAGIGVYLTVPGGDGGGGGSAPGSRPPAASPAAPAPATSPPGIGSTIAPESFDIYRLLPFAQREFAAAADVAQRFTASYGTYRFDEEPQAYVQRFQSLVADELRSVIARSASAPGLIEQRRQDQTVSVSSATLDEIRDIQPNSIIFLVTERQQLTKGGRQSDESHRYAVTVTRSGATWRVYAFEPADVGQAGDTG